MSISFKDLILRYKFLFATMILLTGVFTAFSLMVPNLTGQIINQIEVGSPDSKVVWLLLGVIFFILISESIQVIASATYREKIGYDLRKLLMSKIASLNYTDVNNIGIGQIITLFGSDIKNIKDIMAGEFLLSLKAIMLFLGSLILLFITDWRLGLIAFVSLPVIVGAFAWIFSKIAVLFNQSQKIQSSLGNSISQNVYGSDLVRVQNAQEFEIGKFNYQTGLARDNMYGIISAFSSLVPIINTVVNWTTFGIIYFGAVTYLAGEIKLGDINAYVTYYALLSAPIFIIGFNSQGIARLGVSLKRINKILEKSTPKKDGDYKADIKSGIKLSDVVLEYNGKKVLNKINLDLKVGQSTAILGPTGAGKSMLINIITGMIKPTHGSVDIDGVEISKWDNGYIKEKIATVYQDSLIFAGDLKQNIILNRALDQQSLNKALETSTLIDLFKNKGHISELGGNLSGGQKQRLTLARALYGNPQFLLLDDFTARVDTKTESVIRNRLKINYPNTTIIAVSQTIETIKNYDQIILIMEGEVLMTGTHQELLDKSPEYNQILKSQQTL